MIAVFLIDALAVIALLVLIAVVFAVLLGPYDAATVERARVVLEVRKAERQLQGNRTPDRGSDAGRSTSSQPEVEVVERIDDRPAVWIVAIAVAIRVIFELLAPVAPYLLAGLIVFAVVRLVSWYRGRW